MLFGQNYVLHEVVTKPSCVCESRGGVFLFLLLFLGHTHRFQSVTKELMAYESLRTISLCNWGPNGPGDFAQSDFLESNHQP